MKNFSVFILRWKEKIPQESLLVLQTSLEKLSENDCIALESIPLKNPTKGLLLGISLGGLGIDRFYKGDIWFGFLKIFLHTIFAILYFSLIIEEKPTIDEWQGVIYFYFVTIWLFASIDAFLVYRGIKQDNLRKIQTYIGLLK